tara:strand:- start:365 stop:472 length:108 start_codon:yes stop_codon:yes gene_type:complete
MVQFQLFQQFNLPVEEQHLIAVHLLLVIQVVLVVV